MKQITFYFDFISPYAYLAFEHLPKALEGQSYHVRYRPVLFAGMLKHFGQLGPAEIHPKRTWTYRQMYWHAREHGIPIQAPEAHPFNPLPLLRLAIACGDGGYCNRHVAETIFRFVWRGGLNAADPARIAALAVQLQATRSIDDQAVRDQLIANTSLAISEKVFGVPSMAVNEQVFWGFDALPMLRQFLEGDPWFYGADWQTASQLPMGVTRIPPGDKKT